ncbi:MAG: HD domain-containing protein [Candidatus Aenigmarchaeota archaeon]|nr:HD domain-containing protein [Candidatus Aenigmarchaeota archaeon]
MPEKLRDLADYLFSLGMLKRTERSGWRTIGIQEPESVAEHSFVSALVGAELAKMEGADETKVVRMCLLHDLHELRMGDLNKMNKRYLKMDEGKAFAETVRGSIHESEMKALFREMNAGKSKEALLVRDAHALEMMLEAKFLLDSGNPYAKDWIRSARAKLKSRSAKKLAQVIERQDSLGWMMKLFEEERKRG